MKYYLIILTGALAISDGVILGRFTLYLAQFYSRSGIWHFIFTRVSAWTLEHPWASVCHMISQAYYSLNKILRIRFPTLVSQLVSRPGPTADFRSIALMVGLLFAGVATSRAIEEPEDRDFKELRPQLTAVSRTTEDPAKGRITTTGYWIPDGVRELHNIKPGPLVKLDNGAIVAIEDNNCCISRDGGQTWTTYPIVSPNSNFDIAPGAMVLTSDNVLILSFTNLAEMAGKHWQADISDMPHAVVPTYAARSLDFGKTWQDIQKLHQDWTGANRDMVETKHGSVVFTSMMMRHGPARHTVLTYTSRDSGVTWLRSNIIDLGGIGHHSGVSESTLVQLKDNRLWMLMRTNWGSFWETFSTDEGLSWKNIRPTNILTSSTPGILKRLQSGRLLLVWNFPYPEGENCYPLTGGDKQWSEVPVSNHRGELSMAFSEDEGQTWSKRTVIARTITPDSQLTYPNILEFEPGVIWITTGFRGDLIISLNEVDFIDP